MPSWLIWVIIAIVVVAIIAAVLAAANKKKQERNRSRAAELREQATAQATGLQQREAHAKETEAQAAQARAEAERKQAEAERLEAEAQDRHQTAAGYREQHVDNLRRADELDPDVDTRSDDYAGPETAGATHDTADHETGRPRTAGDLAGHETQTSDHRQDQDEDRNVGTTDNESATRAETATVTHPDGTTETVNDPQHEGGTHRA